MSKHVFDSKSDFAFPSAMTWEPDGGYAQSYESGMTLRDYIAIKAMHALLVSAQSLSRLDGSTAPLGGGGIANAAYLMADAMLTEREKKP